MLGYKKIILRLFTPACVMIVIVLNISYFNLQSGKREQVERKKRRRKKDDEGTENEDGAEDMEEEGDEDEEEGEEEEAMEVTTDKVSNMNIDEADGGEKSEGATSNMFDDGVFQVKIGPALGSAPGEEPGDEQRAVKVFQPHPRMGPLMAVKNGVLFLYGGMFERGDKQFTFKDFYSLDLSKMEEWNVLIENDESKLVSIFQIWVVRFFFSAK
jgi:hypothetical protein